MRTRSLLQVIVLSVVAVLSSPISAVASEHEHAHHGKCKPTAAQHRAAMKLVEDTRRGLAKIPDGTAAALRRYHPWGVPQDRGIHWVNLEYSQDSDVLNPDRIESIVFAMTDDGYRAIGALYVMPEAGMKGPTPGGCMTEWHDHSDLPTGNGREMLHVWIVDMPGGPFAHRADPDYVASMWQPAGVTVPVACMMDGRWCP